MITLASNHPAQEAFAFLRLISHRAETQLLFRQLADWGRAEVAACGELFSEIATDASHLSDRLDAASSDGVFSAAEREELQALVHEIHEEARTGKIS